MRTMHPLALMQMMRPRLRRRTPSLPRTALIRRCVPPCLLNSLWIFDPPPPRIRLQSVTLYLLGVRANRKLY